MLLNVKEVAKALGISVRQVWRLSSLAEAGQSKFPRCLRLGEKTCRWRTTDLERYVAELAGEKK